MALVRFLDGKQRGKTATVDDSALRDEGRYRFKKTELTTKRWAGVLPQGGGQKRWVDKKMPEWTAALDDDSID